MLTWRSRAFWLASLGTAIEYFDYSLFSVFLAVLAPVFFPDPDPQISLSWAYWVLSISMWIRPFSSVLFGWIGDHWGRRPALLVSVVGITCSTGLLAVLPGHEWIGAWAFYGILTLKIVQVFCFSGEYIGAGVYIMEHTPPAYRGLASASMNAITSLGTLCAASLGVLFHYWGMKDLTVFRAVCGFGALMGLALWWARVHFVESPEFLAHQSRRNVTHASPSVWPIGPAYRMRLLTAFFLGGLATVPFLTVFSFLNPQLVKLGIFQPVHIWSFQAGIGVLSLFALLLVGYASNSRGVESVMQTAMWLLALIIFPAMLLLTHAAAVGPHARYWIYCALGCIILPTQGVLGLAQAYMRDLFPVEVRYRGIALGFGGGLAAIGGTTLLLEQALYRYFDSFLPIAGWMLLLVTLLWTCMAYIGRERSRNEAASSSGSSGGVQYAL